MFLKNVLGMKLWSSDLSSEYISEELISQSPKVVESTKEQELQSALTDITIQMREISFFNTKLTYVTKLLMGSKNFTAEEKIELCKKFDVISDIQEAKKIYEEYIKFDTQISDEAKAVIRDKLVILAGQPSVKPPVTTPDVESPQTSSSSFM